MFQTHGLLDVQKVAIFVRWSFSGHPKHVEKLMFGTHPPKIQLDPVISSRSACPCATMGMGEVLLKKTSIVLRGWPQYQKHIGFFRRVNPSDFSRWRAGYPDLSRFFEHWALWKKTHTKGSFWLSNFRGSMKIYPENVGFSLSMKWNSRSLPTNIVGCIFNTAHCSYGGFSKCGIPKTVGVNMFQYQNIPNIFSLGCFWVASGELT